MTLLPRTPLPATLTAAQNMGKQIEEGPVQHRRVEITVEREVLSYVRTPPPVPGERCGHCGQIIPFPPEPASLIPHESGACGHPELPQQPDTPNA